MAPVLQDASAFNLSLLADYPPEQLTALKRLLRDMITRYSAADRCTPACTARRAEVAMLVFDVPFHDRTGPASNEPTQ